MLKSEGMASGKCRHVIEGERNNFKNTIALIKVDKLLKEDCEKNGEYCDFNRRFLNVLNQIPSVSNYNQWSLKKHYDSQCCYYQRSVQLTSLDAAAVLMNVIMPMKNMVLIKKTVMMIEIF